jgi:ribosome-binding protein aMBF1 (putative translation factor)
MARTKLSELTARRRSTASAAERKEFDDAYATSKLAIEVGEKIRDARHAAGLSQRRLAELMGTSQAAIARLEAGGVGATLTTLQRLATALDLRIEVVLRPASRTQR